MEQTISAGYYGRTDRYILLSQNFYCRTGCISPYPISMTTFVLIHGGNNNGSVWDKVTPYLIREGHQVFAPTLADPDKTTLAGHISEVCALIEKNRLDRIILAGHSYGSMVITGTADRVPERIDRLVYIDSVIPRSGDSLFGIMEECGSSYKNFGLVPDRPFIDPLYFDEEKIRNMKKTYVHCTKSEFLAIAKCASLDALRHAQRDHWTYYELSSPHHCMNAVPNQVAAILLRKGVPGETE